MSKNIITLERAVLDKLHYFTADVFMQTNKSLDGTKEYGIVIALDFGTDKEMADALLVELRKAHATYTAD